MRVAIIGGGIAGMGCAWALHRSGYSPSVYEKAPDLGGNAKTQAWATESGEVITGLSVLAWPEMYFHNYGQLLGELGVEVVPTGPLRYFIKDERGTYAHGREVPARYRADVAKWAKVVAWVRRVNARVAGRSESEPASLYEFAPHNPMHAVPLRLLARSFGVSKDFWERVVVPVHSSSFLTIDLDGLPASIAPVIDDIVSVVDGARLLTWKGSSRDVFSALGRGFEDHIFTGAPPRSVGFEAGDVVVDAEGSGRRRYDAVVFACNPHDALAMMGSSASRGERLVLGGVEYPDEIDATFLRGDVHSDTGILPEEHRADILSSFANYVERRETAGKVRYENTFVLSSWVPAAQGSTLPMMVSYNRAEVPAGVLRSIRNDRAHPCLTTGNLARAAALRFLQGKRNVFYCGSYATPGNGHDLSLLSGLVVASRLGAHYPFSGHVLARRDFANLRRFMLGGPGLHARVGTSEGGSSLGAT